LEPTLIGEVANSYNQPAPKIVKWKFHLVLLETLIVLFSSIPQDPSFKVFVHFTRSARRKPIPLKVGVNMRGSG